MRKKIVISLVAVSIQFYAFCQTDISRLTRINAGVGAGWSYGYLGGRINCNINPHFFIFGSIGTALIAPAYNAGVVWRVLPNKLSTPTVSAFYGTNTGVSGKGLGSSSKIYTGFSLSAGYQIRINRGVFSRGFYHVELIVPIRSNEFYDDYNSLKQNPNVTLSSVPPVTFSIGWQYDIYRKNK